LVSHATVAREHNSEVCVNMSVQGGGAATDAGGEGCRKISHKYYPDL
jgi:hypothetical protein